MQRPSERLIKEFNLYKKFKEKNIRTVLNLQEPGEVKLVIASTLIVETASSLQSDSATFLNTFTSMEYSALTRVGRT